ncbi:dihydrofolate reductase [Candidatus Peregrinibacteria bacterium]|nr:dihydrofolate reductase [Candidatus Peregrinibacteria bacterium]
MKFSLIAAADEKMGIGKSGRLPWHIPADLKFFHDTTIGRGKNAVIMGRTTWESIPEKRRPLAERTNIVLTHQNSYAVPSGVLQAASLQEALQKAQQKNKVAPSGRINDLASPRLGLAEEIFVIGGAKVFEEAIGNPNCQTIYLTEIFGDFRCDAFFPKIDPAKFKKISESPMHEENNIKFRFVKLHDLHQ